VLVKKGIISQKFIEVSKVKVSAFYTFNKANTPFVVEGPTNGIRDPILASCAFFFTLSLSLCTLIFILIVLIVVHQKYNPFHKLPPLLFADSAQKTRNFKKSKEKKNHLWGWFQTPVALPALGDHHTGNDTKPPQYVHRDST